MGDNETKKKSIRGRENRQKWVKLKRKRKKKLNGRMIEEKEMGENEFR